MFNFAFIINQNETYMKLCEFLTDFICLFYPKLCVICGDPLLHEEDFFCLHCALNLPKTNYHLSPENRAVDRFAGKILLEKACSYLYYNKGGIGQKVIAGIKYRGNIPLGKWMGQHLANEIRPNGFFDEIDYLVPIPLHPKKFRKRGFNQAEVITVGISSVTHIPMESENLYRKIANTTQTRKGVYERWRNTKDIFELRNPELFGGKHILIIDDVLTTGSTLEAAAQCILKSPGAKISILTLAIA
jgi:ComF family protein